MDLGGPAAFREARSIRDAGRVLECELEGNVLRGVIESSGKCRKVGFRFISPSEVENLCQCRESQEWGKVCGHSLALILQRVRPVAPRVSSTSTSEPSSAHAKAKSASHPSPPPDTASLPAGVSVVLEGSLKHLEAEVSFATAGLESAAFGVLLAAGFEDFKGKPALRGTAQIESFLSATLPRWERSWAVTIGERLQHVLRDHQRVKPHLSIAREPDGWLYFQVHYSAGDAILSPAQLNALLQGGGSPRLPGGQPLLLDQELPQDIDEVLRDCDPEQVRGGFRINPRFGSYLEESVAEWTGQVPASPEAKRPLGSLKEVLRPYQIEGVEWLLERAGSSRGGLLADDMGLGKTIQALALFQALGEGPFLVVCPASLVWNWQREAERFTPELPVLPIIGSNRSGLFSKCSNKTLVLTSYGILRRDIDKFCRIPFEAVVLDEAQHIKNPDSQNARAATRLQSRSRFALSGTPIENSMRDLWSLYEFLEPRLLGTREDFESRYVTPLTQGPDPTLWRRLLRRTSGTMLRRTKAEILPELPPKIEQVLPVELTSDQQRAYTGLQRTAQNLVAELKKGKSGRRMAALSALLRLRQACCDLRLLGAPSGPGTSAKREALMELLRESADGGHRVLVFSQFTSMLDLIAEDLEAAEMRFSRLDGATRNRKEVVEEFEEDDGIGVFLICLKAGGTGLNLTSADTVVHFDPWWNPAVEAQATDRVHRIGQAKVVNSIKIVCRNTVEERVLQLQESKRELMKGLLEGDEEMGGLGTEDLEVLVA